MTLSEHKSYRKKPTKGAINRSNYLKTQPYVEQTTDKLTDQPMVLFAPIKSVRAEGQTKANKALGWPSETTQLPSPTKPFPCSQNCRKPSCTLPRKLSIFQRRSCGFSLKNHSYIFGKFNYSYCPNYFLSFRRI